MRAAAQAQLLAPRPAPPNLAVRPQGGYHTSGTAPTCASPARMPGSAPRCKQKTEKRSCSAYLHRSDVQLTKLHRTNLPNWRGDQTQTPLHPPAPAPPGCPAQPLQTY